MTINDPKLNASCLLIRKASRKLEHLLREGKVHALGDALAVIECEAREGGYLVNNMMFGDDPE